MPRVQLSSAQANKLGIPKEKQYISAGGSSGYGSAGASNSLSLNKSTTEKTGLLAKQATLDDGDVFVESGDIHTALNVHQGGYRGTLLALLERSVPSGILSFISTGPLKENQHQDFIVYLIKTGKFDEELNRRDGGSKTFLEVALENNWDKIADATLDKMGADSDTSSTFITLGEYRGMIAIELAIINKKSKLAEKILDKMEDKPALYSDARANNPTLLRLAVEHKQWGVALKMLEKGAYSLGKQHDNAQGWTTLVAGIKTLPNGNTQLQGVYKAFPNIRGCLEKGGHTGDAATSGSRPRA